jgi:hypothetical protein
MVDPGNRASSLDQMMLAERPDGARLGTMLALVVGDDQSHLVADVEAVERSVDDAVAVEVDLLAFGGLDEPVALVREQPQDLPWTGASCAFTRPVVSRT